mmetsp:Transcript_13939/g.38056  ORF Transcript_13939/g.38056 Transcript_13939/m.38056 type:complete len:432 (-) Transcript_13939:40-1335(-)
MELIAPGFTAEEPCVVPPRRPPVLRRRGGTTWRKPRAHASPEDAAAGAERSGLWRVGVAAVAVANRRFATMGAWRRSRDGALRGKAPVLQARARGPDAREATRPVEAARAEQSGREPAPTTSSAGVAARKAAPAPRVGWACWPPSSLEDVVNLYGGPRRFLLVNVPVALLALAADFLGSMRALLSFDALQPAVRPLRLDGLYVVRGLKRHYIDAPLSCTFTFPGDWIYDPALEVAFQKRRAGPTYTMASGRGRGRGSTAASAPLPLVSVCPQAGAQTGFSVSLYANSAGKAETLAEALGPPEDAAAVIMKRFVEGAPSLPGQEAQAELVAASTSPAPRPGGRESYHLELRVRYVARRDATSVGAGAQAGAFEARSGDEAEALSVWATAQLAERSGGAQSAYVLFLTGVAPFSGSPTDRDRVRAAAESLDAI